MTVHLGNFSTIPPHSERGWDLGPFAAMLVPGQMSPWDKETLYLSLSNTRKLLLFSHSVVSNSLWPPGPQHARPPCPSPTPGVYSNSWALSQWWHPTISSLVVPFSSCLQYSGSFEMNQLFISGGHSIEVLASASVLPMNIQDWFPLRSIVWLDFLAVQRILKSLI